MAIPPDAPIAEQPIDPTDRVEFVGRFAPEDQPLLADGETILSLVATPLADAAALGFTILEGEVDGLDRGPWIADDTMVEVWCEIAEENRADAAFSVSGGASLGIQVTIGTSEFRRFQRTMVVKALQL